MIQFIDLKDQIMMGEQYFAFFDAEANMFLFFDEKCVWNTFDDFVVSFKICGGRALLRCVGFTARHDFDNEIKRFTSKIPKKFRI